MQLRLDPWRSGVLIILLQGKSLSLICGSVTWLREHKRRKFANAVDVRSGEDLERAMRP